MARMKVNAGVRSVMAEAKVGELYPIPKYINNCTQQLKKTTFQSHMNAHIGTHAYMYLSYQDITSISILNEYT